jgi:hypothetical protein
MSRYPSVSLQATARETNQAVNHLLNFNYAALKNAANDGAAATAGVPVGELYRNGSVLMVRIT